jgi:hypothetical protein
MRLLIAMLLFPTMLLADHLPEDKIALGKPETVLCGIDVSRSHVRELVGKFGKPVTYDKYPKTKDAAEITWEKSGSRIHAYINVDDIAYAVDVSGDASATTTTGRGLGLGQKLADLQRIYGNRFVTHGNRVTLQWRDGSELRATIANDRIVSLTLVAPVE